MVGLKVVGRSLIRRGLEEKLTGEAKYTADLKLPGMLHAKVLSSPHPHADVVSIDASVAEAMPGVHALFTPFDEEASGVFAGDMRVLGHAGSVRWRRGCRRRRRNGGGSGAGD